MARIEQELKSELSGCFSNHASVFFAYLARVSYIEKPGVNISLCIFSETPDRRVLLPCIEDIFRKRFHATQHMDIIFLPQSQLSAINEVAKPFYTASTQQLSRINPQGD